MHYWSELERAPYIVDVVDWRSVNIPDSSPGYIVGVAVGSILRRTLAACGRGKSLCVRPLVCTQL